MGPAVSGKTHKKFDYESSVYGTLKYKPVVHMPLIHQNKLTHEQAAFLQELSVTGMIYPNQPIHMKLAMCVYIFLFHLLIEF